MSDLMLNQKNWPLNQCECERQCLSIFLNYVATFSRLCSGEKSTQSPRGGSEGQCVCVCVCVCVWAQFDLFLWVCWVMENSCSCSMKSIAINCRWAWRHRRGRNQSWRTEPKLREPPVPRVFHRVKILQTVQNISTKSLPQAKNTANSTKHQYQESVRG